MKPQMFEAAIRVWKSVPDFPLYCISNDGRVRRVGSPDGVFIAPGFSKKGRPRHRLRRGGGVFEIETHLIVARAFLPKQPVGKTWVLHRDDNPLNCVDTNLRWGDRWDNALDYMANRRIKLGIERAMPRIRKWRRKGTCLIGAPVVLKIFAETGSSSLVASKYGVSKSTVVKIRAGEYCSHITGKFAARA